MAKSLAEIRAQIQEMEDRKAGKAKVTWNNAVYPQWDIPMSSFVRMRFVHDPNPQSTFFYREKAMIKLPFAGIKGVSESQELTVQVPCMEMYGPKEHCPVLAEVRTWFKDAALEELGKRYWKKRTYIAQGFVRESPLKEENVPENPIRRFIISPQVQPLLLAVYKDPEIEELPTDFNRGLDFFFRKEPKAGSKWADYSSSGWARKESSLTEAELEAIEKYGISDLSEFLPKKPGPDELRVIKEMFEASVDGQLYDPDRWGEFYGPKKKEEREDGESTTPTAKSFVPSAKTIAKSETVEEDAAPWDNEEVEAPRVSSSPVVADAPKSKNPRAEEILAMIANRKKA